MDMAPVFTADELDHAMERFAYNHAAGGDEERQEGGFSPSPHPLSPWPGSAGWPRAGVSAGYGHSTSPDSAGWLPDIVPRHAIGYGRRSASPPPRADRIRRRSRV